MRLRHGAEQLTLLSAGRRASRRLWQGDGKVLLTCDGSGLSFSAWCERFAPAGSWQRTLSESLALSLRDSTGSAVSLRLRATKCGRSLLVPSTSERRTSGTGCGLWPTAQAIERDDPKKQYRSPTNAYFPDGRKCQPTLMGAVNRLWPTETAQDSRGSGAAGYSTESGRHPGTTLTDAASGLWATPRERDHHASHSENYQGDYRTDLHSQARSLWASPQEGDWRSLGEATPGHSPQLRHSRELLAEGALDWETPQTRGRKSAKALTASTENGRRSGGGNSSTPGLEQQAELAAGTMPREMVGVALAPQAARFAGLLAQGSHSTSGSLRGSLNAEWVAALQGFPPGWIPML